MRKSLCVCVCVCVRDTSSTCCTRVCTRMYVWLTSAHTNHDFNVDDHFHLEMIVNINVIILKRVLADV